RSDHYIKSIKTNHPELAIISYESFQNKGKNFLKVTVLNDSMTLEKSRLSDHDNMVKDIHLIWQYSPRQENNQNPEVKNLQTQISALQEEIQQIKSQNNRN
ncbi:MAG TPA: hypothetical protein PK067_06440, partial [Kaistella chaponensis]|nr:hypothetical protein [Kaistella chaponensis]